MEQGFRWSDSGDIGEDVSIYEYAARSTLMLYGDFVKGTPNSVFAIISEHSLGPDAVKALRASAEKLGYGDDGCAWVTLRHGTAGDATADMIGEKDLRTIIEGIDPLALVATDNSSSRMLGRAFDTALEVNASGTLNGRPYATLGDFSLMLKDDDSKQRAWRLLKALKRD